MSLEVSKETTEHITYGVKDVTASATQLTSQQLPNVAGHNYKGVLLKAPGSTDDDPNTLSVFIGNANVTADQAATGGFPLAPGESLPLPIEDAGKIFVIGADANQKINWILM